MPFLLMVLLTLVCLPDLDGDGGRFWPEPLFSAPFGLSPVVWSALLTGLATALVGLNAFWMSRRIAGPLRSDPHLRDRLLPRYERWRFFHQFALFGALALALCVFGWGWAVPQFWRWGNFGLLPCPELLVIAPFLVGMVLSWLFFYDADRASHQAAYQAFDLDPLARALLDPKEFEATAPPHDAQRNFGGRWAYVLFQMRQKLALVLLPVGLLLAQKELLRRLNVFGGDWQTAISFAGVGCVLLAFVSMPWVVRLMLGLKPMPPGPLRKRLLATAKRLGFRCSNILLWNTRSGMGNAMVVGVLPWPRYVVFTDRLLEDFTPEEVEAVFGHEVGHVKHHHMLFYLGFLGLSIMVLIVLSSLITTLLGETEQKYLEAIPQVIGLIAYIFLVFGFVSRRCERQADVYGCRAVSCTSSDCQEHGDGVVLAERGRGLCPTGIRTFIRALEKVAIINGISRDRPGFLQWWQHSTIAKRVEFLQSMLVDPRVEPAFQRRVALVKWGLAVMLGILLGALIWSHQLLPPPLHQPPADDATAQP
jgi:Zn-dependent protease with chaperone function